MVQKTSTPVMFALVLSLNMAGAMALKMPPPAPEEGSTARLERLTGLWDLTPAQLPTTSRLIREEADAALADRLGPADRAAWVARARARHEAFRDKMTSVLGPEQREKMRAMDRLWDDFDGDILWIVERCRMTANQGERVGELLLEWKKKNPAKVEALENAMVFPEGEAATRILSLLTAPQQGEYQKVRREMEAARAEWELGQRAVRSDGRQERAEPGIRRRSAAGGAGF